MTTTFTIELGRDALGLGWPDGGRRDYPYIWLRDNDPAAFHPDTQERVGDLLSVDPNTRAASASLGDGGLEVAWSDGARSCYALDWLALHGPGYPAPDAADLPHVSWRGDLAVPRHDAVAIATEDAALLAWLRDTVIFGLTIVGGVAAEPGAGLALAERIGFLRRTNFGIDFDVVSKPDPNNLAYTALALPLHTDLANQELPPGYQFLHCIANDAEGGGSVFADGVAMAEALRQTDPDAFDMLARVPIPFRFHDRDHDIRVHRPVINLTHGGEVHEIKWNAHLAGIFDMPAEIMPDYYRAYRAFMALTRDPGFQVRLRLAAGDMAVFDNRRVLHGRDAFDPSTGGRRLQGCYVDRGEVLSRLRVLAR
ncbi:TauD/TfdA family dioxygenase [Roseibacterium sp. SDUM158016]|uniref:TauD/TfdA family dioxygenase n=1 Tax=Roseicyclus sediminis TaxID=2980997 RepID=UPI0021CF7958|nr:TauD/TfdA family dioxygenase [Roseibacterium sp. SDUM158016]MCU4654128.1 TauD/TfdA family dioxygenase [Roseibacterium sp. SDUM158016]